MQGMASTEDPIFIEQVPTHHKKQAQNASGALCGDMLLTAAHVEGSRHVHVKLGYTVKS